MVSREAEATAAKDKICGRNIEDEIIAELTHFMDDYDREVEAAVELYRRPSGDVFDADANELRASVMLLEAARHQIVKYAGRGGRLDYKPEGNGAGGTVGQIGVNGCPKHCGYSFTVCDMCVDADFPGNFALGFCTKYCGMPFMARIAGRLDDPAGEGQDDKAAYDGGKTAADSAKKSRDNNKNDSKDKDKNRKADKKRDDDLRKALCEAVAQYKKGFPDPDRDCTPCKKHNK